MGESVQRLGLLERGAEPRLTKAIADLQIDADKDIVLQWISSLAEAIQDLWGISAALPRGSTRPLSDEVKRQMQERKERITKEFGFARAEDLELNTGMPVMVVPDYFLAASQGVKGDTTIAVAKVVGSWERRWGKGAFYYNMRLETRPIISYGINNATVSFSTPLNLSQEDLIYRFTSYLSPTPFIVGK